MSFIILCLAGLFNWLTTTLGASIVYFSFKNTQKLISIALGGSAGIMIAAMFFSLLRPALDTLSTYSTFYLLLIPCGFFIGALFFILCDRYLPMFSDANTQFKDTHLLMLAMTLHNIPEGLAVGVAFGAAQNIYIPALILSIGIGIQNLPEGSAISLPLLTQGFSKNKAFMYGQLSGFIELPFALLGYLCASHLTFILPFALSFAAGAMFFVCIENLIPASKSEINRSSLSCIIGFVLMMTLDILLS